MENFWSLLKRGLHGTYVSVEPFHLFRYLDERMFTFNMRDLTDLGRFTSVLRAAAGRRLTYAGTDRTTPRTRSHVGLRLRRVDEVAR